MAVQGQLVGVALSFLRNFGILSGASGVLGALSSGVASAALDDRFAVQRAQQKQVGHHPVQGYMYAVNQQHCWCTGLCPLSKRSSMELCRNQLGGTPIYLRLPCWSCCAEVRA